MHIYHRFWPRLRGAAWPLLLALGLVLGLAHPSLAHKVNVYAYAEGDQIKGEGYFPGGDKAQDSLVELLDGQGKLLGSTHTDSKGEFSLAVPAGAMPPLKVVLKATKSAEPPTDRNPHRKPASRGKRRPPLRARRPSSR